MKLEAVTFQGLTYHVGKNMSTHFAGESVVTGISLCEGAFAVDFENGVSLVLSGPGIALAERKRILSEQKPALPPSPEVEPTKKMTVAERMAKARAARQKKVK